MKCDNCKFRDFYTLGIDECGAGHTIELCFKGHWQDNPTVEQKENNIDIWENCKDFEIKSQEAK